MTKLPSLIDELRAIRGAEWKRARREERLALWVAMAALLAVLALTVAHSLA